LRIDEDDLEPLGYAILPDPVRVEHLEVGVLPRSPLLGYELQALSWRELGDAHPLLPASHPRPGLPAASSSDSYPDHDEALFGFVAKAMCSIDACRLVDPDDRRLAPPAYHPLPHQLFHIAVAGTLPRLLQMPVHSGHLPGLGDYRNESDSALINFYSFLYVDVRESCKIVIFGDLDCKIIYVVDIRGGFCRFNI
jgi:hypothetical protein